MSEITKYRSKSHMLLLYPDCPEHYSALEKIKESYDYCAILHDRDVYTEDTEDHVKGELKKPHWHVVLRFNNQTWNSAIAKDLNIELNYIKNTSKFDNAMAYLIHLNDTDKAQYNVDEAFGNMKNRLNTIVNKGEKDENERVCELLEYINLQETIVSVAQFAQYCASNGYWSEFRRAGSIFCKILEEHNFFVVNKNNEK